MDKYRAKDQQLKAEIRAREAEDSRRIARQIPRTQEGVVAAVVRGNLYSSDITAERMGHFGRASLLGIQRKLEIQQTLTRDSVRVGERNAKYDHSASFRKKLEREQAKLTRINNSLKNLEDIIDKR